MKHAAEYWSFEEQGIRCSLCPHYCLIHDLGAGVCGTRTSAGNELFSDLYGEVSSLSFDPIEKKPLYHFHPGSSILSIGTLGCNMKCPYCQNWHISQRLDRMTEYISPSDIIALAEKKHSIGIAYTYSEPIVWYEYVRDCASLAKKSGLVNIMVSNGFICSEPREKLIPLIDAWNIDLKTFDKDTYRREQKGDLDRVCESIRIVAGCAHLEITTLLVTGMNDSFDEMDRLTDWLASVNDHIPWHLSRYFPNYSYQRPPTDIDFMVEIYIMAKKKLHHVYCGNISGHADTQQSYCLFCGGILVSRSGYRVSINGLDGNRCSFCGAISDIVL
jgi:pyruvate formate lyase activating enzyme